MIEQLLREWPPGFGGVERVAHELATIWGGAVHSFDVQFQRYEGCDPFAVRYPRRHLPSVNPCGRLHLPLPSRSLWLLLRSTNPLHGHLPSPGVLLVLVLARLIRPRRCITVHWHSFLDANRRVNGHLYVVYEWFALRLVPLFAAVVTTSPALADELLRCGCSKDRIFVLPCCLNQQQELSSLALSRPETSLGKPLRVLFIGRLDSYKRLDWLLHAMARLTSPCSLSVVGDGPKRSCFEQLSHRLFPRGSTVRFHGRLSESAKLEQLAVSDLLVLPSDCSNEAFGIAQLEAMAAGRIALAFDQPRSGMGWVGRLSGLSWTQSPEGLTEVLQRLSDQPLLRQHLCVQARERYCKHFARGVWLQKLHRFSLQVEGGMFSNSVE